MKTHTSNQLTEKVPLVRDLVRDLEQSVLSVFVGSRETVRLAVCGLLASLHVLIEDIPGVGKTTLALALAKAAGLDFSRIQFTPDMLPSDVLGMNVWEPASREFVYKSGPVNASFVLADELNRASPRTQSAFLEAMQEGQITVDGVSRPLPQPFFLMATENPLSFTGTFPLPEAELDRFGLSFSIGYPSLEDECEILRRQGELASLDSVSAITDAQHIQEARAVVRSIHLSDAARLYLVEIIRSSRYSPDIRLGASPRAAVYLQEAARFSAAAEGRAFVIPEDIMSVAPAVLAHRIVLSSRARLDKVHPTDCIRALAAAIPKPTGL